MAEKNMRQTVPTVPLPVDVDRTPPRNAYYDKVAARCRTAKYLTLFLLIVVILGGFFMGSGSVTYANFVYLLRDFDTVLGSGGETVSSIHYGAADDRQYLVYRDGLTLVSSAGVEFYNVAGKRTLNDNPGYAAPCADASAQYMLVYDMGGNSYSLYNSLTRIYTETLDFPISGGTVSDSGMYAVITRTREYTSAVLLYGKNSKLKNRYLKDKYVIDAAISDDGSRIAIVSAEAADGAYLAEFQLCEPGKDSALATLSVPGVFPMAVRFFDDNSFAVLCDSALYFYGPDGESRGAYSFSEDFPTRFALDGSTAALVFPANVIGTESLIREFSPMGELIREVGCRGKAQGIALSDNTVYLMTEQYLYRLPEGSGLERLNYAGGGKALLPVGGEVLLCTSSTAYRYSRDRFAADGPHNEEAAD